jgi:hypothetical protein
MSVLLMEAFRVRYMPRQHHDYVLQLRWDLGAHTPLVPRCLLGETPIDPTAHPRFGTSDWDRFVIVPRRLVPCWTCLVLADRIFLQEKAGCSADAGNKLAREYGEPMQCSCDKGYIGE